MQGILTSLRQTFKDQGATIKGAAAAHGVKTETVSRWLNGTRPMPLPDLFGLLYYLGKEPREWLHRNSSPYHVFRRSSKSVSVHGGGERWTIDAKFFEKRLSKAVQDKVVGSARKGFARRLWRLLVSARRVVRVWEGLPGPWVLARPGWRVG
jgi:predicted DCC family thiol-disulfide oxidoreductase YuxK